MRAFIRILESPNTKIWFIPLDRAIFRPCHKPQNSATLFDSIPSPQANLLIVIPSAELINPPAPASPGFPFEAPSKKRLGSFSEDLQRLNSVSSSRTSHCSVSGAILEEPGCILEVNMVNQLISFCWSWMEFLIELLLSRTSPRVALA